MIHIGEEILYCDKCGMVIPVSDSYLKAIGCITEEDYKKRMEKCEWCNGDCHILHNDDILSYKQLILSYNHSYLEMNGYNSIDECYFAMEQKVIKEFISKLPTFDEYAMYDRLEKKRIQKEQAMLNEQRRREEEARKPHCPNCNSTNIQPISGTKRIGSILAFGILSKNIGKQFECRNCKYKW